MTDVLIEPGVHHVLWDEFVKTPQLIAAGEEAAHAVMPQIKAVLEGDPVKIEAEREASRAAKEI
jgi:hypothetical protein